MIPGDTVIVEYPGLAIHGKRAVIELFDDVPPLGRCASIAIAGFPDSFWMPPKYLRVVRRASPWAALRRHLEEHSL